LLVLPVPIEFPGAQYRSKCGPACARMRPLPRRAYARALAWSWKFARLCIEGDVFLSYIISAPGV